MRRGTIRAVVALCATCLVLSSCTATIERVRQPNLEARIVRSDEGAVYVISDSRDVYRVPAETVADIDHPGNVLISVGGAIAGFAILSFALAAQADGGKEALYTMTGIFGTAGAGLLLGGLIPYLRSTRAAGNVDLSRPRTRKVISVPALELADVPRAPSMKPVSQDEPGAP